MLVKINTKGNFKVFEVIPEEIHANMAEELKELFQKELKRKPADAIVDWKEVRSVEAPVIRSFEKIQSAYQNSAASFVMTGFSPSLLAALKKISGFETLNTAPTLAEAIDLVMMEKLERELLDPDE